MVSTFVNPVLNPDVNLGMQGFDDEPVVRLYPNASVQEIETVIQSVYRQVLGNAYVMDSERLTVAESQLRNGESSVRDFVRQVALSDLYRDRFVEPCTRSRTIELNFKHLLGRAPTSYDEIVAQGQVYDAGGYEAEIDSYLDSEEYQAAFGDDTVPYPRGYKTQNRQSLTGFTHWFSLVRSPSSTDKDVTQGNRPRLNRVLMANSASVIYRRSRPMPLVRPQVQSSPLSLTPPVTAGAQDRDMTAQTQSQADVIQQLRDQLADLQRSAAIGAAITNAGQYSSGSSTQDSSLAGGGSSLARQVHTQAAEIERLKQQISESRALAAVGEARLNRWRSRVFN